MSFGLIPDIVTDVVEPAVEHVGKVVAAVGRVFAGPQRGVSAVTPAAQSAAQRTNAALFGPGGPPAAPPPVPPPPGPAGGLADGAGAAADRRDGDAAAAARTDGKLAGLLGQIFASNQRARDAVTGLLADIQAKSTQIAPEMGDPASVMAFQKYLDEKFGQIQKVLGDAAVDATTQAALMDALGHEYRTQGPPPGAGDAPGSSAAGAPDGDGDGGGGGGDGGDAAPPPADPPATLGGAGGEAAPSDPLAGLGGLGMGGLNPLSSLAGMGSALPGMFGGLGGAMSPLDAWGPALGGLGSTLPTLAARTTGDGGGPGAAAVRAEKDRPPAAEFTDDPGPHDGRDDPPSPPKAAADPDAPAGARPEPVSAAAPAAAAPAAAPAPAPHTVALPDGTSVTAPDARREEAVKAVLTGSSVSAAYGDQIPPAGSPVMDPVDRDRLRPGDYAQFDAKPAVMYVGNGKIWLDGKLEPVSALPSSADFLGWTGPPAAGAAPLSAGAPADTHTA